MADVGFNLLITTVLKELHEALMQSEEYVEGSRAIGTFVPPVAWMNDIALHLATTHADLLNDLVKTTVAATHRAFRNRGLTMNLDRGKAEAILMYRGHGAVQCRKDMFAA